MVINFCIKKFVIVTAALAITAIGNAQDYYIRTKYYGIYFGYSVFDQDINQFDYEPYLLMFHHSIPLTRKNAANVFSIYFEPQINPVLFDHKLNIEFGLNTGLMYSRKISRALFMYVMLGSGPHYINAQTQRQAKGFIFSDNIAAGIKLPMPSLLAGELNVQTRLRHISNAGLKSPNGGINNLFLVVGYTKPIQRVKKIMPKPEVPLHQ